MSQFRDCFGITKYLNLAKTLLNFGIFKVKNMLLSTS